MNSQNDQPSDVAVQPYTYPHLFRLSHWVLTGSLLILVVTGLSLHAAARPEWSLFSGVVPEWLWRGRMYVWHFWAAVAFFPAVLASLAFCWQRRFWLRPTHAILIGGGLVMTLTGLWMMFPFGPVAAMKTAVGLHAAFGLAVLPLGLLWHAIGGLTKYLPWLVPSFRPLKSPRWGWLAAFLPVVVLTTWIMFDGWPLHPAWRDLAAARVEASGEAVVDLSSLPWDEARPLSVRLLNGVGFDSGQTDVVLQALHDGNELFVKAVWRDPIANFGYWPWKKTKAGWEHLETSSKDETVYYEDKFSLAFPIESSWQFQQLGCALHCHVDGQWGWGYKGGSPKIDAWHWKSARTDPVGQVDDKYWSEVELDAKDAGRHGDPSEGGGYEKNTSEDGTRPQKLPDGPAAVKQGAILAEHAVDYTKEAADAIAPGELIPSLVCAPFLGDRGDIACQSQHEQGRWTLYIRRKLDTGSEYDVRLVPGGASPFGCAAFDHAAKRHAYSPHVLRLTLAP